MVPLQYSCLENSMDRGALQAIVHGITKSQTRLSNWAHTHVSTHTHKESCETWIITVSLMEYFWFLLPNLQYESVITHVNAIGSIYELFEERSPYQNWRNREIKDEKEDILINYRWWNCTLICFDFFWYMDIDKSHKKIINYFVSVQFSSVAQSCPTLCDPMYRSTQGLPVHHHLLEFTQTHVHWVGDAIQPSHPLSSPSPPAPNPSQHQSLFQWVNFSHEVAKVLEFQL